MFHFGSYCIYSISVCTGNIFVWLCTSFDLISYNAVLQNMYSIFEYINIF